MLPVPNNILTKFEAILEKRRVAVQRRFEFKKWLRYFLDFCSKYPVPDTRSDQVRLFIEKLRDKGQSLEQQKQAAYAVSLYFETQQLPKIPPSSPATVSPTTTASSKPIPRQRWRLWEDGYAVTSDSPQCDTTIAALASEIKTRHYSCEKLCEKLGRFYLS